MLLVSELPNARNQCNCRVYAAITVNLFENQLSNVEVNFKLFAYLTLN